MKEFDNIVTEVPYKENPDYVEALVKRSGNKAMQGGGKSEKSTAKIYYGIAGLVAAAAVVALIFVLGPQKSIGECEFTTLEIAQNINTLFNMNTEDIESIIAEPQGANVILKTIMKDGSSNTFIMSRNPEDGSTKILAKNNVKSKKK